MDIRKINCPNCGASLDCESQLHTLYCKYCGSKIERSDTDNVKLLEKSLEYQHIERMEKLKIQHQQKRQKLLFVLMLVFVLLFILIMSPFITWCFQRALTRR